MNHHLITPTIVSKCAQTRPKLRQLTAIHRICPPWQSPKKCKSSDRKLALWTARRSVKRANCWASCMWTKSIWKICWSIRTWNGPIPAPSISPHWPTMPYDSWIRAKNSGVSNDHAQRYPRRDSRSTNKEMDFHFQWYTYVLQFQCDLSFDSKCVASDEEKAMFWFSDWIKCIAEYVYLAN